MQSCGRGRGFLGNGAVLLGDMVKLADARVDFRQTAGLFGRGHGNIGDKASGIVGATNNFSQTFASMTHKRRALADLLRAVGDQGLDFAGGF